MLYRLLYKKTYHLCKVCFTYSFALLLTFPANTEFKLPELIQKAQSPAWSVHTVRNSFQNAQSIPDKLLHQIRLLSQPKANSLVVSTQKKLTSWVLKHTAHQLGRIIQLCLRYIQAVYRCTTVQLSFVEMRNQTVEQSGNGCFSATGFPTKQNTFSIGMVSEIFFKDATSAFSCRKLTFFSSITLPPP